jgi:sulfide:quinone oxidoreductase
MADQPAIVVVGAGFGGLGCVHTLSEHLSELSAKGEPHPFRVILLDPSPTLSIGACWQFVWTGRLRLEDVCWSRDKLVAAGGRLAGVTAKVGSAAGRVAKVNLAEKTVVIADGTVIPYHQLVLAPGPVRARDGIPGFALSRAVNLCDVSEVERMTAELQSFIAGVKAQKGDAKATLVVAVSRTPYKCPPAPFEVACLADECLRSAGARDGARVVLAVPGGFPFGGPKGKKQFESVLADRGIDFLMNHALASVADPGEGGALSVTFQTGDDSLVEMAVDCMFATLPQRAPGFMADAGLTNKLGLSPVDIQSQRSVHHEDVLVLGDACHAVMKGPGKPHPKAGEFAHQMGVHAASCVVAKVQGKPDPVPASREGICMAEIGAGGAAVCIQPKLSACVADPDASMPSFLFDEIPAPEGSHSKVAWIDRYIERFFGAGTVPSLASMLAASEDKAAAGK